MRLKVQALVSTRDFCMWEVRQEGFAAWGEFSFSTVWKGKRTSSAQQSLGKEALRGVALRVVELGVLSGLTQFHQVTWALLPQGLWLELHCYAFSHGMTGRVQRI